MKPRFFQFTSFALCILFTEPLSAEDDVPESTSESPDKVTAARPPEQLDQLFGPIALYPDALVALILPAATNSSDVVLAARYLDANGDPAKTEDENWDDSVKALAHYPEVVKWMDENLSWTKQAGDAFIAQPADVMNSIQRLRARARAAGTLVDTPQQQVVMEEQNITIIPAQPDVIYVPTYDPDVVYVSRSGFYNDPFLTFGAGYATGFWLGYDFDWGRRRIWTIDRRDRERYWHEHHDWRRPPFPGRPGFVDDHFHQHQWRPRPDYSHSRPSTNRPHPDVVRPVPFPNSNGGSNRQYDVRRGGNDATPRERDHRRDDRNPDSNNHRRPDGPPPSPSNRVQPAPVPSAPAAPATAAPGRAQPTASKPSPNRDRGIRDSRETGRPDRREAQANASMPQGRVAPVQSTSAHSESPRPVYSRSQQATPSPAPQSRSAPSSPPAKADRDYRNERSQRQ